MDIQGAGSAATGVLVSLLATLLCANMVLGQTTTRVSVSSTGEQANASDSVFFFQLDVSADGRSVAFLSDASNLVQGDTNDLADIFVHDRQTGQTTRVNVSSSGGQANNWSLLPSISADGRFVAFESTANNLVLGDSGSGQDVFVHDRQTGQTSCLSVNNLGQPVGGNSPSISANGRFVAFSSYASNLVLNDTNNVSDIFVHDRLIAQITRVSITSLGEQANQHSNFSTSISADGRFVAFSSVASNLVPGDTNSHEDIFVHDRLTGLTSRVSVSSAGQQGNANSTIAAIADDGRFVAFHSHASNLVPGDTNGEGEIFVHDRLTGQTSRVGVNTTGEQANSGSLWGDISANGRFVVFGSRATNLVPDDINPTSADIFIHDRLTGRTSRVNVSSNGEPALGGASRYPAISADGRFVAFYSGASNLVPGDTNNCDDTFVHEYSDATDTDGDGLLDDWEENGIPYIQADGSQGRYILDSDNDGIGDASPLRKDIFVEIDAMAGAPFSLAALAEVRAAFDAAPVPSPAGVPGGLSGVRLHTVIDTTEWIPFEAMIDSSQLPTFRHSRFGTPAERSSPDSDAMLAAKAKAYRYCLFVNRMTDSEGGHLLGIATGIPGTTFAVSLGGLSWPPEDIERYIGSTFMHELGHTLGLCHGGSDHRHYKPNYISVMNYNFDELFQQVGPSWVRLPLDYSRELLGVLNEECLDETTGVTGSTLHAGVSVPYAHTGPTGGRVAKRFKIGVTPIDWNGDSDGTGTCVTEDITWFPAGHPLAGGQAAPELDSLSGFQDWQALVYAVPPLSPIQLTCGTNGRVCELTEELVIWHRANLQPPACTGDVNDDRLVDGRDLSVLLNQFQEAVPAGTGADFNSDGIVDGRDLSVFLSNFGTECVQPG